MSKLVKKKKKKEFKELPFQIIRRVLRTRQFKLERKTKYKITDFFGYFKGDYSRTIFVMFNSFYPTLMYQLFQLPYPEIVSLDFHEEKHWNRDAFEFPERFVKEFNKLQSLERVFFTIQELKCLAKTPSVRTLEKLAMEVKYLTNQFVQTLNTFKKLKYLTIYAQKENTCKNVDFDGLKKLRKLHLSKHCFADSMLLSGSFGKMRTLKIYTAPLKGKHFDVIKKLNNLVNLHLYGCNFDTSYVTIFKNKNIKVLDLSYSKIDVSLLKHIQDFPKFEVVKLTNIEDIPSVFILRLLKSCKDTLREIDLEGVRLEEEIEESLLSNIPPKLEVINLHRNNNLDKKNIKKFFLNRKTKLIL